MYFFIPLKQPLLLLLLLLTKDKVLIFEVKNTVVTLVILNIL